MSHVEPHLQRFTRTAPDSTKARRYTLTEYAETSEASRAVYEDYLRCTGASSLPVWLKSLGHDANLAHAYWERTKGSLYSGTLPLALKELIVFIVSAAHPQSDPASTDTEFEPASPSPDSVLKKLYLEFGCNLPDSYRAALQFTAKASCARQHLKHDDFERLTQAGFKHQAVIEIVSLIDLATMFRVYSQCLGLEQDPDFRAIL